MLQTGSLADSTGRSAADQSTSSSEQQRLQSSGDIKRPEISEYIFCFTWIGVCIHEFCLVFIAPKCEQFYNFLCAILFHFL